ncbi:hypothetical protein OG792_11650 [Micromonospora sp. NBC_01699]|uniref:MauE/DoxX family redox-associated membrane protein n=1 Tax=Micromonospora sp. NBC_01699 TaxID=2975984 RepID=UPI002E2F44FA|nr:MauE/DoxX family redox-associated membrane protein [Micromonospora sp. NBC_01699]
MQYLELTGRLLLGLVFLTAVVGKVRGRDAFTEFVGSVDQFGLLPSGWTTPVAGVVVAAEASVVLLLVAPVTVPIGYAVALGLLTVLTAAMVTALLRGRRPSCLCFGTSGAPIGLRHVLRNVALLVVAAAGLALSYAATGPVRSAGLLLVVAAAVPLTALVVRLDDLAALFAPAPPVRGRTRSLTGPGSGRTG